MLIDWVTARIGLDCLSDEARQAVALWGDRMVRYCPRSGEVRYESSAWDSVRSDSHQIAMRVTGDLWVQGSPARVCGDGDTVFGSGPSSALDLLGCVRRIVAFVEGMFSVRLPDAVNWNVSRLDVTASVAFPDLSEVRQGLSVLRGTEGGRYRVSQKAGDTVYHGGRSKLRRGKAYAKGPHLEYAQKQPGYSGRIYSDAEIADANKLMRLEVTLGREWFRRVGEWHAVTPERLVQEWESFYGRMLGGVEVMESNIVERVHAVAIGDDGKPKPRQAIAALACWHIIQQMGWERAKAMHSKSAWYRHLQLLHAAGLGDADISQGNVVVLRRVQLHAARVDSWAELHQLRKSA